MTPSPPIQPFSLLIKPAGPDCNIRCEYCFYLEKCGLYPDQTRHRMDADTLQKVIAGYMATPQPIYSFGWQGGEPTLMGADFFRTAFELQRSLAPRGATVANGLQTNGTLLDADFAQLLAEYRVLVGISVDGPADLHDRYRRTVGGGATHHRVMQGISHLQTAGVEFNVLTLVSAANVDHPTEVYRYLKSLGVHHHQYIPCVEPLNDGLTDFSITAEQWGNFLNGIFDEWQEADTRTVSVRHFDSVVNLLVTGQYSSCTMGGSCRQYLVVEHNGDVYPCDFFVTPELRLGNIHTHSLEQAWRSPLMRRFGAQKARWPHRCGECPYLPLCSGDCQKLRLGGDAPSALCEGWVAFYDHALPRLKEIAARAARRHRIPMVDPTAGAPEPEAPCFCGSGKRYRNCHGAAILHRCLKD
ncbi:MAG: anaerobic sulfatase maturase [Spirochaetaceae bacterium]|nr:MAG: anaerobic sulfatase maturase [Spirochaetaceae bacterium]